MTRRLRALLYSGFLASAVAAVPAASSAADVPGGTSEDAFSHLGLTRIGATGLVITPNTSVTPDGDMQISAFGHSPAGTARTILGSAATAAVSFGFLPNLELGVTGGDYSQGENVTGNVKWRILTESGSIPSLAVGVAEVSKGGGAGRLTGDADAYIVLGHTFLSRRLEFTGGLLHQTGTRPFIGVNARVAPGVSLAPEYDGHHFNAALMGSIFHDRWQFGVERVQGGWAARAGFRFSLKTGRQDVPERAAIDRRGGPLDHDAAAAAILSHLAAGNLENLRCSVQGSLVRIAYEDRVFAHNPLGSLAFALATAATWAPGDVGEIEAVVERDGVPVIRVACPLSAYLTFMDGGDADAFRRELTVDQQHLDPGAMGAREVRPTYGHGDLFLRPGIYDQIETEGAIARVGLTAEPDLQDPLAPGVSTELRAQIPLLGPLGPRSALVDRAQLDISGRPVQGALGRLEAGAFPGSLKGAQGELLVQSDRYPLLGSLQLAGMHEDGISSIRSLAAASLRYYAASTDTSVSLTGGRFLYGDTGGSLLVQRRFGDTELGVSLAETSFGGVLALNIAVPLGPGHIGDSPSVLRVRPPDFINLGEQTSVGGAHNTFVSSGASAILVPVGLSASEQLLARDRLNRQYILRSLALLRRAGNVH